MNFKQWFNVFLIISEVWQGYDSKGYGVSNHNLKLQCKKFNRTRDIRNFPTQGWADTAFCTRKQSETYMSSSFHWEYVIVMLQGASWINEIVLPSPIYFNASLVG